MKQIGELSEFLKSWSEKTIKKCVNAQIVTAEKIMEDAKANAPYRNGTYVNSIKVGETVLTKDKFTTKIYSDLPIGGDDPKWARVPLGALLEFGTGIKGAISNTYPHGYPYRLSKWVYYDKYLHMFITTEGMVARPHFIPALNSNVKFYKDQIRKAVKSK